MDRISYTWQAFDSHQWREHSTWSANFEVNREFGFLCALLHTHRVKESGESRKGDCWMRRYSGLIQFPCCLSQTPKLVLNLGRLRNRSVQSPLDHDIPVSANSMPLFRQWFRGTTLSSCCRAWLIFPRQPDGRLRCGVKDWSCRLCHGCSSSQ